jgi:ankyrin repeat protein
MMFPSEVSMTDDSDVAALIVAAETDQVATIERLLADGVAIDGRDTLGRTALLAATHHNSVAAAGALIAGGADVNAKDAIHDSPYLYAAAEGRLEILRLTLTAGADLTSTNRYGGTGLIPAAHHGYPDVVATLLATDIDIDHVNRPGWTALIEAVILGDGGPVYQEIVGLLLDAGADPDIADPDDVTPLGHARQRGFTEIAVLIEAALDRANLRS